MLDANRAAKLCTLGPSADGFSFAATKLLASSQGLSGSGGLHELAAFKNLTHVDVASNKLTTLAGLERLPHLASLIAADNTLVTLLDFPASSSGSCLRLADFRKNRISTVASPLVMGRCCGISAHTQLEVRDRVPT